MSLKTVHLRIYGVVQGVFFRQATQDKAIELGITGWVRNCEDGSVETIAEGEEATLKIFMQWCHRGPERAEVTMVLVDYIEPLSFTSFEVRR